MIRSYRGVVPRIAASAYVDRSAQVIGDVEIGERSSVWPNVTVRGDTNSVRIGEETSIQDNSVLHCDRVHSGCKSGTVSPSATRRCYTVAPSETNV